MIIRDARTPPESPRLAWSTSLLLSAGEKREKWVEKDHQESLKMVVYSWSKGEEDRFWL